MVLIIDKNLFFIDNLQFMNSSLMALAKNLPGDGFNCLSQEIGEDLSFIHINT